MKFDQRDIVLIPFPYTDLTGTKQRPALIISNKKLNSSQDRICCLITSNTPEDGVKISKTEDGKLPFESWVKPHRIFTIHQSIIKKKIARVPRSFHERLLKEIAEYTK